MYIEDLISTIEIKASIIHKFQILKDCSLIEWCSILWVKINIKITAIEYGMENKIK